MAQLPQRYKNPVLQRTYEYLLRNPPVSTDKKGIRWRRIGAGVYFPFWHGYDGATTATARGCPDSRHRAAYMAGRSYRRLDNAGLVPTLKDVRNPRAKR